MKLQEAALICSAIAFILYINTLDCGYCFDDESAILQNQDLRPHTPWTHLLEDDFWGASMTEITSHKSYRPLTVATFRLNYMLHELEPLGYHLVNVLLHSAVVYLYVLLCGVVFSEVWPALIAGLLFAVHPIHTEAVAGVVGRAELLCSIFYLFSIFCYRKATTGEQGGVKVGWFCTAMMSVLCSALSKEQGITAVAVCMAYDALYIVKIDTAVFLHLKMKLNRSDSKSQGDAHVLLKGFATRGVVLMFFTVIFMAFRLRVMGGAMPTFYFEETNPAALEPTPYRQLNWLYLCWVNAWLLLNPSPLCADWANGTVPLVLSLADLRNLLTLTLFVFLAFLLTSAVRREKTSVLFSLSLLVLPYLPASNLFFPVGFVVAERVLYLPSMGFCMLVSLVYKELTLTNRNKKWAWVLKIGLVFVLVIQSGKTVRRNRDWVSQESLWKSAVPVNPSNSKVFTNLAKEYERRNETGMVLLLTEHALQLQPRTMLQWTNLAFVHKSLGHFDEAEKYLRGALNLVPEGKKMAFHVGNRIINVYGELGNVIKTNTSRLKEATNLFSKAVSLETTSSMKAYWKMVAGECYLQMRDHQSAMNQFQSAVDIEPGSAETNYNLAVMYGKVKDKAAAEKYLRRALEIKEDLISALASLAVILSDSNDTDRQQEAFLLLERAVQLEPGNFKHFWRIGKLHLQRQEYTTAKSFFHRALQLDPHNIQVWYSLGKLHSELGIYDEAVSALEKVVAVAPGSILGTELLAKAYRETGQSHKAVELEKRLQNGNS